MIELPKLEKILEELSQFKDKYYIEKATMYWYTILLRYASAHMWVEVFVKHAENFLNLLKKSTKFHETISTYFWKLINMYDEMSNKEKAKSLSVEYLEYFQNLGQPTKFLIYAFQLYIKFNIFAADKQVMRDVIKQYQHSAEVVFGKESPEYVNSVYEEAKFISYSLDKIEGYNKWVQWCELAEKIYGTIYNDHIGNLYRLMALIKYEMHQYPEALELINKWKDVEMKIGSINTPQYSFLTDYEKKIADAQKQEEDIQKAKENSIIRKLIPNTKTKVAIYLSLILATGVGLIYLSKKKQSE